MVDTHEPSGQTPLSTLHRPFAGRCLFVAVRCEFLQTDMGDLAVSVILSHLSEIRGFADTCNLEEVSHALYAARATPLRTIARTFGAMWAAPDPRRDRCTHRDLSSLDLSAAADTIPDGHWQHFVQPEQSVIQKLFDRHPNKTFNGVTGETLATLVLSLSGTHALVDNRGRSAAMCRNATISYNCQRSHRQRAPGVCTSGCHVSGCYSPVVLGDDDDKWKGELCTSRQIVLVPSDKKCHTSNRSMCVSLISVLVYAMSTGVGLSFCANSSISYAANTSSLMFVAWVARSVGLWRGDPGSEPILAIGTQPYVQLCGPVSAGRSSVQAYSRCIAAGSVHTDKRLLVLHKFGATRIAFVLRVDSLLITTVGGFTTIGRGFRDDTPRVFQCAEIVIAKCISRNSGRSTTLDPRERVSPCQSTRFYQQCRFNPVEISVLAGWPEWLSCLPVDESVKFHLRVSGLVDIKTVPRALLSAATMVTHGDTLVTHTHKGQSNNPFSCLLPTRRPHQHRTGWL